MPNHEFIRVTLQTFELARIAARRGAARTKRQRSIVAEHPDADADADG